MGAAGNLLSAALIVFGDWDDPELCEMWDRMPKRSSGMWIRLGRPDDSYRLHLSRDDFLFESGCDRITERELLAAKRVIYRRWRNYPIPFASSSASLQPASHQAFAQREWDSAIRSAIGIARELSRQADWSREPLECLGERAYLLWVAGACGLDVPAWQVVTDAGDVGDYAVDPVVKAVNTDERIDQQTAFNTTRWPVAGIGRALEGKAKVPVFAQRHIRRQYEVRVVYSFGDITAFRMLVDPDDIDIREVPVASANCTLIHPPSSVRRSVDRFCEYVRVRLATFDFVLDDDQRYWLVDVNLAGGWEYITSGIDETTRRCALDTIVASMVN